MGRMDRRQKLALDEAHRYYRCLEDGAGVPELFRLVKCLSTVTTALAFAESEEFKITRQLWRRLQLALFDKLIANFPGYVFVSNAAGGKVEPGNAFPDDGALEFHPDNCRRGEDIAYINIAHLYPRTFCALKKVWNIGRNHVDASDFAGDECESGVCPMKPVVFGKDLLFEESTAGKGTAYQRWWDLYWQAYCTQNRADRQDIYQHMMILEEVWGNLYY